eukprot:CAMPEP_0170238444 /NCGR_PEP_ID=MMETSP0116_2-20130129/18977_1 /TAXON_ID=400756 /ORGANISM="Durinskia baltica, Strain CSIRO CS-38" /LENGTH=183 /DNA_ID=CAMNT_0010489257 /DNA_START=65 /DNA_END=616 /DNA_ORIENTATION=+
MAVAAATAGIPRNRARINHMSVYAANPKKVAQDLAFLIGGHAEPNGPLRSDEESDKSWICLFNKEDAKADGSPVWLLDPGVVDFLEVYPRSYRLIRGGDGRADFEHYDARPERGVGVHFNLSVDVSRAELEALCAQRGLRCAWREYLPLLDVWLEEDPAVLIELVPPLEGGDAGEAAAGRPSE